MLSVRFHGRGGQGVVTAAELLAAAAFSEGRHAQAFPSFGSERMGAPVMSFKDGPCNPRARDGSSAPRIDETPGSPRRRRVSGCWWQAPGPRAAGGLSPQPPGVTMVPGSLDQSLGPRAGYE